MTVADRAIYVETGVGMATDAGCAAWSFDLDLWGTCTQGTTVSEAVDAFARQCGPTTILETVHGDEQAFARDRVAATDDELALTLNILADQRSRALSLLASIPEQRLDVEDPHRDLPAWATWRSIRDMFWHICDTESRYYLPRCGLASRSRAGDLEHELSESAQHVRSVVAAMPRNIDVRADGEEWTSTKLLRRLAWHERGELDAIELMLTT